jgi:serine/threonine protein phosphatase PrpC
MSVILRAAAVTDLGLVRSNNEDSLHIGRRVVAIADGMGGLPAGELASDVVIKALAKLEDAPDDAEPLDLLTEAVKEGNNRVAEMVDEDPSRDGMGTTVTALMLSAGEIGLVHVGDSRCYLLRENTLEQVTRDDTLVQSLVDRGTLTAAEARSHPQRSLVTQAIQGRPMTISGGVLEPHLDDRYLLCSDGLSDVVTDEAIGQALASYPQLQECAETLVKLAVQAGGPDNISVIVADVTAGPQD